MNCVVTSGLINRTKYLPVVHRNKSDQEDSDGFIGH